MPFHVYAFERFDEVNRRGHGYVFLNLDEAQLRERIVGAWDRGIGMTWDGRTVDPMRSDVRIYYTDDPYGRAEGQYDHQVVEQLSSNDVTNEWIHGPAGVAAVSGASGAVPAESPLRDHRRVMVVYGRNTQTRDAIFMFLRSLGLSPIEWEQAVAETGLASPHNLVAVRAAMDVGQAVVVVLTAEDQAGLLPDLGAGDDDELLRGQPRQNVILEAGLAMGVDPSRVVLVEIGEIRRASDFDGLNTVRLTNAPPTRAALRSRLMNAGCAVDEGTSDWMRPEASGDFESVAIRWTAHSPQ